MDTPPPRPTAEAGATPREHRPLSEPMLVFDLEHEADQLRAERPWQEHGGNARTLAKHPDLRVVCMLLKAGERLVEHRVHARVSLHTLRGHVRLRLGDEVADLPAGRLLVLQQDVPHDLEALEESTLLLTVAWEEGRGGPDA